MLLLLPLLSPVCAVATLHAYLTANNCIRQMYLFTCAYKTRSVYYWAIARFTHSIQLFPLNKLNRGQTHQLHACRVAKHNVNKWSCFLECKGVDYERDHHHNHSATLLLHFERCSVYSNILVEVVRSRNVSRFEGCHAI